MKILSVSDVITNSSSEVFIIDKKDLSAFPRDIQEEEFTIIDKSNFIEEIIHNHEISLALEMLDIDIPNIFDSYNIEWLEALRELHSDEEIVDFFGSILDPVLNKAIAYISDEYDYGCDRIELIQSIIADKQISAIMDRV